MNFTDTNTIAETLATHLNTLTDAQSQTLLKTVKTIHGKNGYATLFEALPDLTAFPAAVISIGNIVYPPEYGGAVRQVECNVTFVERPYGIATQEESAKDHLEILVDALTGDVAGQVLRLEGIPFVMGNVEQLEYEPEYQVWNITMDAMQ